MSGVAPYETVVERETSKPDSNLLAQFAELQRWQRSIDALTEFLRDHHASLFGLHWDAWAWDCELRIKVRTWRQDDSAADIAKRFPGEWQCGVKPKIDLGEYLDWTAQRGLVRIRIENAEVVAPVNPKPKHVTF